jgi:hypothetical protein
MYSLSTIKFIQQPILSEQECKKLAEQHGLYQNYYEDRALPNMANTQTVVDMPLLKYYTTEFDYVVLDKLTFESPHITDEYLYIKSETVKYKSNSWLGTTRTESDESNVCLIICLNHDLPNPINIIMGPGEVLNTETLSFNLLPGQAVVYPCDNYGIFINRFENEISAENLELSSTYIKLYYKIISVAPVAPVETIPVVVEPKPMLDDTGNPIVTESDIYYDENGDAWAFGTPYEGPLVSK